MGSPLFAAALPTRSFSKAVVEDGKATAGSGDESIFASADYFKDVSADEVVKDATNVEVVDTGVSQAGGSGDELLYMDANDALGTSMAFLGKDWDNLIQGVPTYGFSEAIVFYETALWDLWMFFSEAQGMGMGFGIIAASLFSRAIFAPLAIYG